MPLYFSDDLDDPFAGVQRLDDLVQMWIDEAP